MRRDAYVNESDAQAALIERLVRRVAALENDRAARIIWTVYGSGPVSVPAGVATRLTNGVDFVLQPHCRYRVVVAVRAVSISGSPGVGSVGLYSGGTDLVARFGGYHHFYLPSTAIGGAYINLHAEWFIDGPAYGPAEQIGDFHPGGSVSTATDFYMTMGGTAPGNGTAGATTSNDPSSPGNPGAYLFRIEYLGGY